MEATLLIGLASLACLLIFSFLLCSRLRITANREPRKHSHSQFTAHDDQDVPAGDNLTTFLGGEDLTVRSILEAPGEVMAKLSYGTLYVATLERNRLRVLRFVRPACCGKPREVMSAVGLLGLIRHQNLVPLQAFYAGPKGERLLVHPFYRYGNLAQFIREGKTGSHDWDTIRMISINIARGLDHLHTGLHQPLVHGNLKSKIILLDRHLQPRISDFGLHLLLSPTAAQDMLDSTASEGYKPPEVTKMKDVRPETDIYNFGVILLELLTGKEAMSEQPPSSNISLPDRLRNAAFNEKVSALVHPDMMNSGRKDRRVKAEESIMEFFRLAMSCCAPLPSYRPHSKQVLRQLEGTGK